MNAFAIHKGKDRPTNIQHEYHPSIKSRKHSIPEKSVTSFAVGPKGTKLTFLGTSLSLCDYPLFHNSISTSASYTNKFGNHMAAFLRNDSSIIHSESQKELLLVDGKGESIDSIPCEKLDTLLPLIEMDNQFYLARSNPDNLVVIDLHNFKVFIKIENFWIHLGERMMPIGFTHKDSLE